jgi:formylglycine-generating enzyme required for sulfatase activity
VQEWYKAAYYKGGGTNAGYWTYPTQSNTAPSNVLSATGTNNANYYNNGYTDWTNNLTPVRAFNGSPGPYGTYDMGGDVANWTETADTVLPSSWRVTRGCSWVGVASDLASSGLQGDEPEAVDYRIGFRVADVEVPEPGSIAMLVTAAVSLLAYAWRKRRQVA